VAEPPNAQITSEIEMGPPVTERKNTDAV